MTFSLRLDEATEARLKAIARRGGKTASDVVRDALAEYTRSDARRARARPLYARIRHLIGSVDSGGAGLSEHTGRRFRALLAERVRRRAR